MRKVGTAKSVGSLLLLVLLPQLDGRVAAQARVRQAVAQAYGKLPLSFEVNQGQTNLQAGFLARGPGYTLLLNSTEAVLKFGGSKASNAGPGSIRMRLVGGSRDAEPQPLEALPGKVSYFVGRDPASWRTGIPTFRKVGYKGVYPGIDLVYYGNPRELEFDFVVTPGADPRLIRLSFEDARSVGMDGEGGLIVETGRDQLRLRRPAVYQTVNGARREIAGRFVLKGRREAGFELDGYDTNAALVIDPVLVYSTYLGDASDDRGTGIAVDKDGNAYVAGWTKSPEDDNIDTFIVKLDPSGTQILYLGVLGGGSNDYGYAIGLDGEGRACVTGRTWSADFPVVGAIQEELGDISVAFVAKLNATGDELVYSTFLGADEADAVAVDSAGMIYVTGIAKQKLAVTPNALQRTPGGSDDAYLVKIDPSRAGRASLVYSTYLGGGLADSGAGVAVDKDGNIYVAGKTISRDFPTSNALQPSYHDGPDAFVVKMDPAGSRLIYATYLGTDHWDEAKGIAVDGAGNAYVVGSTNSKVFPTTQDAYQRENGGGFCDVNITALRDCFDAFVVKLSANGSSMIYSTLLGGPLDQEGRAIAVDAAGSVYVTGKIWGPDLLSISKLNPSGSALVFSTFDKNARGNSIAVDSSGNVYVTGETRDTIPLENALQDTFGGGLNDAFVVKLAQSSSEF